MEYTKGEWKIAEDDKTFVYSLNENDINRFDLQVHAGYTNAGHTPRAETEANARLIAAAPTMYEALKLLQSALTEYRLRDVKKRYSLCVADAAAGKALAKAEGKEI